MELDTEISSGADTAWFTQARLGLFIHWGLYALPARQEWVQKNEPMTAQVYQKYFDHFDPDLYDPEQWADVAAQAGMKYVVVTTKHHEGFCLWDTRLSDFKAPNTPARRDLLRPLVEACRRRGLRIGFYYSTIDWHHPQFTIDDLHVYGNHPDRAQMNKVRDQSKYIEFLHGQVRELLTDFGPIDVLWFDGGNYLGNRHADPSKPWTGKCAKDWDSAGLLKMIRQLQPKVLLNDRLDVNDVAGGVDFLTYEQAMPLKQFERQGKAMAWETPQTFSGSWGYHRDEGTWKSTKQCLEMLIYAVSKGGNLLLNVGPTGRGEFDYRAMERLSGMGQWMRYHGRAIYSCSKAPEDFPPPRNCVLTCNAEVGRLYLHIQDWPATPGTMGLSTHLYWENVSPDRFQYAQLLNDASEVKFWRPDTDKLRRGGYSENTTILQLPVQPAADVPVPVVEIFLK